MAHHLDPSKALSRRSALSILGSLPVLACVGCDSIAKNSRGQTTMKSRDVKLVVSAQPTSDGAGVRLNRALGTSALSMLDPFLMLDEFRSDKAGDHI